MAPAESRVCFIGDNPSADPGSLAADDAALFPYFEKNFSCFLPQKPETSILDFGCGHGTFLRYLEKKGYSRLEGFDPDTRCAEFSAKVTGAKISSQADALAYLSNREPVDFLSALGVACYFDRPRVTLWFQALARSLKPGGVLLLSVPNAAGVSGLTDYIQDPYMGCPFTDVLLRELARKAGLRVDYCGGFEAPPGGPRRALWRLARKAWFQALKIIYLLERGKSDRNPSSFEARIFLVARKP